MSGFEPAKPAAQTNLSSLKRRYRHDLYGRENHNAPLPIGKYKYRNTDKIPTNSYRPADWIIRTISGSGYPLSVLCTRKGKCTKSKRTTARNDVPVQKGPPKGVSLTADFHFDLFRLLKEKADRKKGANNRSAGVRVNYHTCADTNRMPGSRGEVITPYLLSLSQVFLSITPVTFNLFFFWKLITALRIPIWNTLVG